MDMIGTVLGELKLEKAPQSLMTWRWIQVRAEGQVLEAVDLAGSRPGEQVLLISGDAAGMYTMGCPGAWAAAAVLAQPGNNG